MANDSPRYSQPRHLVRWKHTDRLERALIGLVILCMNRGIQLPWDDAARSVDPAAGGEAFKQATMKRRDEFTNEGYSFPAHSRSRKNRNGNAHRASHSTEAGAAQQVASLHEMQHQAMTSSSPEADNMHITQSQFPPRALRKRNRDQSIEDEEGKKKLKFDEYDSDSDNIALNDRVKKEEDVDDDFIPCDEKDSDPDFTLAVASKEKKKRVPAKKSTVKASRQKTAHTVAAQTPKRTRKPKGNANIPVHSQAPNDSMESSSQGLPNLLANMGNKEWLEKLPPIMQHTVAKEIAMSFMANNGLANGLTNSSPFDNYQFSFAAGATPTQTCPPNGMSSFTMPAPSTNTPPAMTSSVEPGPSTFTDYLNWGMAQPMLGETQQDHSRSAMSFTEFKGNLPSAKSSNDALITATRPVTGGFGPSTSKNKAHKYTTPNSMPMLTSSSATPSFENLSSPPFHSAAAQMCVDTPHERKDVTEQQLGNDLTTQYHEMTINHRGESVFNDRGSPVDYHDFFGGDCFDGH